MAAVHLEHTLWAQKEEEENLKTAMIGEVPEIIVCWDTTLYSLVASYGRCRGTCCLLQPILKMETASSFQIVLNSYQTARRHITEDSIVYVTALRT